MELASSTLTLWLVTLFAFTATQKLGDYRASATSVAAYRILPGSIATAAGVLLPWLEIAVAALLVAPATRSAGGVATVLLGGVFLTASISVMARGLVTDCGCAGTQTSRVNAETAIRASSIVIAGLVVAIAGGSISPWIVAFAGVVAAIPAGFGAYRRRASRLAWREQVEKSTRDVHRLTELLSHDSGGAYTVAMPTVRKAT